MRSPRFWVSGYCTKWRIQRKFSQLVFTLINPFTPELKKVHSPNLSRRKCISEVARICSIIIFHLSKLWKVKFSILCDVVFLVRLQGKFDIDHSWEWKGKTSQYLASTGTFRYNLQCIVRNHRFCTRKMKLALEMKFYVDFHWVTRPCRRTLTKGSDVKYVFPRYQWHVPAHLVSMKE